MKRPLQIMVVLLLLCRSGSAQGFANMDFEKGYIFTNSTYVIPDWFVSAPYVLHDNASLSGGSISIMDTNPPLNITPIQGKYYIFMASVNLPGYDIPISLGQTGTIPLSSKSIIFWGNLGGMQVTFDSNPLYFSAIGSNSNYTIYGADISTYAGKAGELLFTVPPLVDNAILDNIQFSSTPVPEPGGWALATLGVALFGGIRHQFRIQPIFGKFIH